MTSQERRRAFRPVFLGERGGRAEVKRGGGGAGAELDSADMVVGIRPAPKPVNNESGPGGVTRRSLQSSAMTFGDVHGAFDDP